MVQYSSISGIPISEIEDQALVGQVLPNDLLVGSQQVLSNVSPDRVYYSNGEKYTNEYRSIKVSYDQLSSQLFDDICSLYGLENMAWESSSDYSLANHIHNYSKVSLSAKMTPSNVGTYNVQTRKYDEVSSIATIYIDSKCQTLAMPAIHLYEQPKAYIGQLKFLAQPTFKDVDEYAENFDGWTYPDGRTFLSANFPDAWNAFGTSYGFDSSTQKFAIPNLRNFFKPQTLQYSEVNNSLVDCVDGYSNLETHTHDINDNRLSGHVNLSVQLPLCEVEGLKGIHDSNGNKSTIYCYCLLDLSELAINGSTQKSDSNLDVQTHPTYNYMPVMIYIGTKVDG